MGGRLVAIDLDRHLFDEGAEQLLPVARRGRWRVPDGGEIGSECEQTIALGLRDHPRSLFFAAFQLDLGRLNCAQALLPVAFEAARHQPVVGIDSAITTLGALRLVIGSLDPELPLLQSGFAFDFQPLSGGKGGSKPNRLQGSDEGPSDGLVDLDTADIEARLRAALRRAIQGDGYQASEAVLRRDSLSDFNDGCKDFAELRALILEARATAMNDADAGPAPRLRLDIEREAVMA
jgi:hypothetical protein